MLVCSEQLLFCSVSEASGTMQYARCAAGMAVHNYSIREWNHSPLAIIEKVSGMSRRGIAVGIGLLASTIGSTATAQIGGLGNQSNQVQAAPATYRSDTQRPVYTQAGHHHAVPSYSSCAPVGYAGCGGQCAEEPSSFWTNYYRNVRWPMPFRAQDVGAVSSYFDLQRENGWRMHNTIGHAMFDQQTQTLTQAGRNHIQSILRDNPSNRKVVFVLQGQTPQQTSARVQSTEVAISELLPVGDLPPVYVTDRDAPGSSGSYQTAITKAWNGSVPVPRLTSQGSSGSGSSSSSSGSGSTP